MTSLQHSATLKTKPFVVLVAAIAAIAGLLFGFDTGVISGAILFIGRDYHLTALMNGFVVSAVLLGAFLGSACSGRLAYYLGRRNLLIITAIIFVIGTSGSALAANLEVLISSRFIVGIAIGVASYVAPLYISEVAPAKYRGSLVTLNQLAVTIGIMFAYFIDVVFANVAGDWRWMFAMGLIPALILLFGMLLLPKSPRWLVLRGLTEQAQLTLLRIRDPRVVDAELTEIQRSVKVKSSWRLLFRRWVMPVLLIGLMLGFLQQFCGINTIIYYAPTIFKFAGLSSDKAAILATTIVGTVNVLATIVAIFLIDLLGRKPLLYVGFSGMLVSLCVVSLSFLLDRHGGLLPWLTLASLVVYIASFAVSIGPIMWLMFAEIFPLEVRGLGASLVAAAQWLFNAAVTFSFLQLVGWLGQAGTFLTYAAVCVLGLLFVYLWLPETKGVSLELIERNLRAQLPSRELGRAPH